MEALNTSSYDLIDRFRQGDREAFTPLFDKHRRRLAVLVHYKLSERLRGSMEVDDIVQETFLAAARDLDSFQYRGPGSFMKWLAAIAGHLIIDEARYYGRARRSADFTVSEPVDSNTPSRIFAQSERVRRLLARLNQLPEDYRQVILLAKVEGCSTVEIADKMGRSREAVSLMLHRALKRLREMDA